MILDKVKDLLLVFNMEGLDIVLVTETKYNRKFKAIYNTYKITVWEQYKKDHKVKHRPIYNKRQSLGNILLLLAEALKQPNRKAFFKQLSRSEYFEKNQGSGETDKQND